MMRIGLVGLVLFATAPADAASLVIRVDGVKTADGMIYAGICDRSFEAGTCPYKDRKAARPGTVELTLPRVKPGLYAIAVFQDVNNNGRLDRTFIGLPSEPYGFSNDVGRAGAPDFQKALVTVREPSTTVAISIR